MKDILQRHPRLVFLLIGLMLLIPIGWVGKYSFDLVVAEKEVRIEELSKRLVERERTVTTLTEAYSRLEKQSRTHTIIRADGSKEEWTEDSSTSETQIRQQVKDEYKERIAEEISKVKTELSKVTKEKKKLNITAGATIDMDYYVHGSYSVYGNITLGAGVIGIASPTYLLGIGLNL